MEQSNASSPPARPTVTPIRTACARLMSPSSAVPLPPTHNNNTAVDGRGMWRSWTRVFAKPESACLDLLDNCFDATLKPGFHGKVAMHSYSLLSSTISIYNNSQTPIKRLEDAMTVYKSSKNARDDDKDAIGENGVGLKQGCAALCDCSMVLTRNTTTLEIGLIAKELQSTQGVCLPAFTFEIQDPTFLPDIVELWLKANPDIAAALFNSFGPSVDASQQVARFAQSLYCDQWENEEHVFLLVLCKLKKSADVPHALIESISPAKAFLQDIKAILPEYYINLPTKGAFDFVIDDAVVDFSHWQKRLVELTKFEVYIPTEQPFEQLPADSWDKPSPEKHKLSIYCGFDAQRLNRDMQFKRGSSTCHLYIYSCQAGRLIKKEVDARHMLGLSSSGVDYTQGLTVIVNDVAGKLPLTPTKDGIAWSERTNGEIHHRNLVTWTGAVAGIYWNYFKARIAGKSASSNKVKENLKNAIRSFALEEQSGDNLLNLPEILEEANFSKFEGVQWKRYQANFDDRWKIRKGLQAFTHVVGHDTAFMLTSERIKRTKDGGRGPKRVPSSTSTREVPRMKEASLDAHDNANLRAGDYPWSDVPSCELQRVAKGVLTFLRDKDRESLFEVPVVETLPQIKDDYLKSVSQPMDFHTIEKERMLSYTSIKELQQDLILTFKNCICYNGASSRYGKLAQNMLDAMDDAFELTDIKQVTSVVLANLRDLDEKELFEAPVLEQLAHLPGFKDAYLQVVSQPMDYRTIEDERVNNYKALPELRKDLELIYENCIKFNGAMSVYGGIAQEMLNRLDSVFEDTTLGKRRRKKNKLNYADIVDRYTEGRKKKSEPVATNTAPKKRARPASANNNSQAKRLQVTQCPESKIKEEAREKDLLKRIQDLEKQRVRTLMLVATLQKEVSDRDDRLWRRALPPIATGTEGQAMLKRIQFLEEARAEAEAKNQRLTQQLADRDACIWELRQRAPQHGEEEYRKILRENRSHILFYSEEAVFESSPDKDLGETTSNTMNLDTRDTEKHERALSEGTEKISNLSQSWEEKLMLPGTNKMSEVEKLRVRQFVEEKYNPTPNQKKYKMKIHIAYCLDPESGDIKSKTSYYLDLDYTHFTHKLTMKIKKY